MPHAPADTPLPSEDKPAPLASHDETEGHGVNYWRVGHIKVTLNGDTFFVPRYALHRPAARANLAGKIFEPETHRLIAHIYTITRGDMVHAGAYYGDMLPSFARAAAPHRVVCFEPVLKSYVLARLCVGSNALENVLLVNGALSDTNENLRIMTQGKGGRHKGGAAKVSDRGALIPSFMIDQFDFTDLACIHLDVEGHELPALKGATRTIAQHRPIIMVEDNNQNCGSFLAAQGYVLEGEILGNRVWVPGEKSGMLKGFFG
jgi:FkbM family methyltransferase